MRRDIQNRGGRFGSGLADGDVSGESVATAGNGFDVVHTVCSFAEDLPQVGNVLGEVSFFDKSPRPNFFEKLVLLDEPAMILNKDNEGFQVLSGQIDSFFTVIENQLMGIQTERSELV
jgi:hypothetical protein